MICWLLDYSWHHTCAVAPVSTTFSHHFPIWQNWCLKYHSDFVFLQEFLVAVGVRGATLQHRVVPPSLGWYDQVGFAQPLFFFCLHTDVQQAVEENDASKSHICNLNTIFCLTDCRLSECFRWACVGLRPSDVCHHLTFTPVELLSRLQVIIDWRPPTKLVYV